MQDESGDDACRNGKDSASPSIGEDAKGDYHKAGQYCDFDQDRSHKLPFPVEINSRVSR